MGPCENLKPRGLVCNFPFCVRMPQLYPRPALTSEVTSLLMIPRGGRGGGIVEKQGFAASVHGRVHPNMLPRSVQRVISLSVSPQSTLIVSSYWLASKWFLRLELPRSWESVALADCRQGGVGLGLVEYRGGGGLGSVCVDTEAASGYFLPPSASTFCLVFCNQQWPGNGSEPKRWRWILRVLG